MIELLTTALETVGLFALGISFIVLIACFGLLIAAWFYD